MPANPLFIQRYQLHKTRNILAYVPETHQHWFKYKLRLAYAHADARDARQALYRLHDELNELNPSAAASLTEGLEETLTLHDLQVHARLRRSFEQHQRNQIQFFRRGDHLPPRETLAGQRSPAALGGLRAALCRN